MSDKKDTGRSGGSCKECGRLRFKTGQSLGLGGHNWSCDKCKRKKKESESDGCGGAPPHSDDQVSNKETTPIKLFLDTLPGGWCTRKRRGSNYHPASSSTSKKMVQVEKQKKQEEEYVAKNNVRALGGHVAAHGKKKTEQEEPNFSPVSSTEQDSSSAFSSYSDLNAPPLHVSDVTGHRKKTEQEEEECGRLRFKTGQSLGLGGHNWSCDKCKRKKKESESDGRGGAPPHSDDQVSNKETTPIKLFLDTLPGGWCTRKRRGSNYHPASSSTSKKMVQVEKQKKQEEEYVAKNNVRALGGHVAAHGKKKTEQEEPKFSPVSSTEQDSASAFSSSYSDLNAPPLHVSDVTGHRKKTEQEEPKFSPVSSTEQDSASAFSSSYSDLNAPPLHVSDVTGHRKKTEQESHSPVSRTATSSCFAAAAHRFDLNAPQPPESEPEPDEWGGRE